MEYFDLKFISHQVFWKPAFNVVHFYLLNVPKWAGGYGGLPEIDVCSIITGVSTNILVRSAPELCQESIASLVNGYATLLIVVLSTVALVLSIREFVPMIRIAIPFYFARQDLLKKEQDKMEANRLRAIKTAETKEFHSAVSAFTKTVISVLNADGKDFDKIALLLSAYKCLNPKIKVRLGEVVVDSDDLLLIE